MCASFNACIDMLWISYLKMVEAITIAQLKTDKPFEDLLKWYHQNSFETHKILFTEDHKGDMSDLELFGLIGPHIFKVLHVKSFLGIGVLLYPTRRKEKSRSLEAMRHPTISLRLGRLICIFLI